jgi:hypothetical protein
VHADSFVSPSPRSDRLGVAVGDGISDGYYEEGREAKITFQGNRVQPGTLLGVGRGYARRGLRRIHLPCTWVNKGGEW